MKGAGGHEGCSGPHLNRDVSIRDAARKKRVEVVSSPPQTSALPPRQGLVLKRKLEERANQFAAGQWLSSLSEGNKVASDGSAGATRRRRRNPSDETKALRAERLASLGSRRSRDCSGHFCNMDRVVAPPESESFANRRAHPVGRGDVRKNVRSARRGAAPGPSGMNICSLSWSPPTRWKWMGSSHVRKSMKRVAGIAFGTHDSSEETIGRHAWDCREWDVSCDTHIGTTICQSWGSCHCTVPVCLQHSGRVRVSRFQEHNGAKIVAHGRRGQVFAFHPILLVHRRPSGR